MNSKIRHYLFACIFFAVGTYYMVKGEYVEASLYILAGLAFTANTMTNEPALAGVKKTMVIITWSLIVITGIVFLWVLQSKYF
jgi:hypothetical protein